MVALWAELAETKTAHLLLVNISAQCEADASKTRADSENCKARLGNVKEASTLASVKMNEA